MIWDLNLRSQKHSTTPLPTKRASSDLTQSQLQKITKEKIQEWLVMSNFSIWYHFTLVYCKFKIKKKKHCSKSPDLYETERKGYLIHCVKMEKLTVTIIIFFLTNAFRPTVDNSVV